MPNIMKYRINFRLDGKPMGFDYDHKGRKPIDDYIVKRAIEKYLFGKKGIVSYIEVNTRFI